MDQKDECQAEIDRFNEVMRVEKRDFVASMQKFYSHQSETDFLIVSVNLWGIFIPLPCTASAVRKALKHLLAFQTTGPGRTL